MHSKFLKKGIVLGVLASIAIIPENKVLAAEKIEVKAETKKESKADSKTESKKTVMIDMESLAERAVQIQKYIEEEMNNVYSDMTFAQVDEGSYLFIRTEPSVDSSWVGKLDGEDVATVMETVDGWTKVQSGDVTGYVKSDYILTRNEAEKKAKEIVQEKNPEKNIKDLTDEEVKKCFSYAESKEAEEARLAAEAEAAAAENRSNGQAVVDFAMQFVGNPYVWGGTSLTNGADCSGFVQSVYANFGVSMPRTSSEMRNAGVEVSYSDVMPGDVICYQGHVGIYAGNGKIVNAIDDAHGIGVSSATYANIITVRRLV